MGFSMLRMVHCDNPRGTKIVLFFFIGRQELGLLRQKDEIDI
jgi:hypothetical protein